jgi:hypothetical protein
MCGISRLANHRANSIWSTGVITWLDDSEKTTYDYYETGEVITGYLFAAISHLSLSLICPRCVIYTQPNRQHGLDRVSH